MTTPSALAVVNPLTVQVGPGRMLMSQAPAGLQLVNNDGANAVWISDNPSVAPGTGWRLGSNGGSCTWNYDGEAIYGCVDTGVTTSVTIQAGNSVTNLQDPEAVALATVAGLVAQGIPFNLIQVPQPDWTVSIPFRTSQFYDTQGFATMIVAVTNATLAGNPAYNIEVQQLDTHLNVVSSIFLGSDQADEDGAWAIPIVGVQMFIASSTPGLTIHATGSNQTTTKVTNLREVKSARQFAYAGPFVINNRVILGATDGLGSFNTDFNGPINLIFEASVAGALYMFGISGAGAQFGAPIQSIAAGTNTFIQGLVHPVNPMEWYFLPAAAVGSGGAANLYIWG